MNKKQGGKYAKPSGITLREHTDNVHREGDIILATFPFLSKKYLRLTGKELETQLSSAIEWHDVGKVHPKWQAACTADVQRYHRWLYGQGISIEAAKREHHNDFEDHCRTQRKPTAPCLRDARLRHEFSSYRYVQKEKIDLSKEAHLAIAAHHGKLSTEEYARRRWEEDGKQPTDLKGPYYDCYKDIKRFNHQACKEGTFADAVLRRYQYAAVRTLLQLADTRASRWEALGDEGMVKLHSFPKLKNSFATLRPVQEAAVSAAAQERTILRAPTGSGKTYASLLWAERQIKGERQRADRLVIAMPTRFTSNKLYEAVCKELGKENVGLYHSSAYFNLYGAEGDTGRDSMKVEQQKLTRYLAMPATVCTVDHLLACLTGTREAHYSTFYFLANSCVVFDEVDTYDPFVQANLRKLLEVLDLLRVPTLIMSATVPDSATQLYNAGSDISDVIQQQQVREVYKMMSFGGVAQLAEASADFLDRMISASQGIIYANTVARALDYYRYLVPRVGNVPLYIYHSRFTEADKKILEEKLPTLLGTDEDRGGRPPTGIIIMTQIGEMSINISSTLMLTDCCPWDRLAQRVGRLARFTTDEDQPVKAEVRVVEPVDEQGISYAWPYVTEEKNPDGGRNLFLPIRAYKETLDNIKELCQDGSYQLTPENLVAHTDDLYPSSCIVSQSALENESKYGKLIEANWLLTGSVGNDDNDQIVGNWRARDIADQKTIFIRFPPDGHFISFNALKEWTLQYGVTCPVYKIQGELRKREEERPAISRHDITIGRDNHKKTITCYVAVEGAYQQDTGLASLYGLEWTQDHTL